MKSYNVRRIYELYHKGLGLRYILDNRYTIANGYKNSVNVGLTDIRAELLVTLEVLEDEYFEVDVNLMP